VAILSGIAWDHINVFPTFENYVDQFRIFCELIEKEGTLIFNEEDEALCKITSELKHDIHLIPYKTPNYRVVPEGTVLTYENKSYPLQIFGAHNLQNALSAMHMANELGISAAQFFEALKSFTGAGKRLQKVVSNASFEMFKDFAHSPSKLKATTKAVKEQFQNRKLIACMELHTFSSLKKDFLPHYKDAMKMADIALVYFSPEVVKHKKLEPISKEMVAEGFGGNVIVYNDTQEVLEFLRNQDWENSTLLMMSSGNFDGINYDELGEELLATIKH
jgi:UDP-N-acetylmuramate: L-alanyl-gamma-D-glutamyl-meso-diaminopimelate ligase